MEWKGLIAIFCNITLNVYASTILKYCINNLGKLELNSTGDYFDFYLQILKSPLAWTSFIGFALSTVFWAMALEKFEVSTAFPIATSISFVIITITGSIFLGEAITLSKITGIVLAMAAVYFLTK